MKAEPGLDRVARVGHSNMRAQADVPSASDRNALPGGRELRLAFRALGVVVFEKILAPTPGQKSDISRFLGLFSIKIKEYISIFFIYLLPSRPQPYPIVQRRLPRLDGAHDHRNRTRTNTTTPSSARITALRSSLSREGFGW